MDFLFVLIISFILGIIYYTYDRKKGKHQVKLWYDLTHKDPMNELPTHGVIYRQSFRPKLITAIVFSAVILVVLLFLGLTHPLTSLIGGLGALAGFLLAFMSAPFIFKIDRQQIDQVISKLDEAERGDARSERPIERRPEMPSTPDKEEAAPKKETREDRNEKGSDDEKGGGDDDDWRGGVKKFLDS